MSDQPECVTSQKRTLSIPTNNTNPLAKRRRTSASPTSSQLQQLCEHLQFWLSISNLSKDRHLIREMTKSSEGWISTSLFLTFKKVSSLNVSIDDIENALKLLEKEKKIDIEIKMNANENTQIRFRGGLEVMQNKIKQMVNTENIRTIYIETIPAFIEREELNRIFELYGQIAYIGIPRYQDGKSKGFAFIEFVKEEEANQAVTNGKNRMIKLNGKVLTVIKKEEWVKRKEEYKQQRRVRAASIRKAELEKETELLKRSIHQSPSDNEGKDAEVIEKNEEGMNCKGSTTKDSDIESNNPGLAMTFTNGLILSVSGLSKAVGMVNREGLYHVFEEYGPISYIEYSKQKNDESVIRYMHASGARRAYQALKKEDEFTKVFGITVDVEILKGEKETEYWKKIETGRKKKVVKASEKDQRRRERRVGRREMKARKVKETTAIE